MAKTKGGKKIVCVSAYKRRQQNKTITVKRHKRSTNNQ